MKWVVAEYEYKGELASLIEALILSLLKLNGTSTEVLLSRKGGERVKGSKLYEVYICDEGGPRPLTPLDKYFIKRDVKSFQTSFIIKVKYVHPSRRRSRLLRPDTFNLKVFSKDGKFTIYSALVKGVGNTLPEDLIITVEGGIKAHLSFQKGEGARLERVRVKLI